MKLLLLLTPLLLSPAYAITSNQVPVVLSASAREVIASVNRSRQTVGLPVLTDQIVNEVASDQVGLITLQGLAVTHPTEAHRFVEMRVFLRTLRRNPATLYPIHYNDCKDRYLTEAERREIGSILLSYYLTPTAAPVRSPSARAA